MEKITPKIERIVEDHEEILKSKSEKELKDLKNEKSTYEDTSRKDLAKISKLVESGVVESLNKVKDLDWKELNELATTNIEKLLKENNAKTDEKVTKELDEIKVKYDSLLKSVDEKEATYKKEIDDLGLEYKNKLYETSLDGIITTKSKVEKWKDMDSIDLYEAEAKAKIMANGRVLEDGSMVGLNSDVCTIDGKRVKHIDEAWPIIVAKRVASASDGKDGESKKEEKEKSKFTEGSSYDINSLIDKDVAYQKEQTYAAK